MSENYTMLLDLANVTDEQKAAVEEVIRILKSREGIPLSIVIPEIKIAFGMEDIPMIDIKESVWYQMTKEYLQNGVIQGYKVVTNPDGSKVKVPHVAFSHDLDKLDVMLQEMAAKFIKPE